MFIVIVGDLDERGRRRWAAAEARSLGRGGIAAIAEATGLSDRTIRNGIQELDDAHAASADRQRRPGAGRPCCESLQPELVNSIESLVEAETRGDPMVPICWICQSTRQLARELRQQGFQVSSTRIGQLLRSQGYSLQANHKTVEGKQHPDPDRDAQFRHTAARVKAFQRTSQPVISVDTRKKATEHLALHNSTARHSPPSATVSRRRLYLRCRANQYPTPGNSLNQTA